jgi:formylglycine-generating enzyme required for sulfatase activity
MRLIPVIEGNFSARYKLDDQAVELTDKGVLLVPSYRRVKVSVTIRDNHDVIHWFEGRANEVREWQVPLKPLPGPEDGINYSPPYFDIPLVWIQPEPFKLGSPISEPRRLPNEDSPTLVTFDYNYWIGEKEVTQEAYEHIMGVNPSEFRGNDLPVDSVSWIDATQFCQRLTEFERNAGRLPDGYVYRLPTEAEWEYAARANTSTPFSFGPAADPSMGNFHGSYSATGEIAGKSAEDRYGTLPVGSFSPNPFGLFDVHGNIAEWVLDRFWDRHPGGSVLNFYNNSRGRGYSIRGGSWRDSADRVRTAAREGAPGRTSRNSIGFRVAIAPDLGSP